MRPCSNFENMYVLLFMRSLNGSAFVVPHQRPQHRFGAERILGVVSHLIVIRAVEKEEEKRERRVSGHKFERIQFMMYKSQIVKFFVQD